MSSDKALRATPGGGIFMVVERDEFFAELDGLTEKEIEARLDLWDQEQLALIQEYLDQRVLGRAKAEQAAQIKAAPSAQDDAVVASLVEVASTANTKATAALILSVGAMLAAMGLRARGFSSSARLDDLLVKACARPFEHTVMSHPRRKAIG